MSTLITILFILCFTVPVFAQKSDSEIKSKDMNNSNNNMNVANKQVDSQLLSRLVNTRIIFKDNSIRKNCKIVEINEYWIVYIKEGSMHDLMIEEIKRIEIGDGTTQAVYFDENNKPIIGYINSSF